MEKNCCAATKNGRFRDYPEEGSPLQKSLTPLEDERKDNSWEFEN